MITIYNAVEHPLQIRTGDAKRRDLPTKESVRTQRIQTLQIQNSWREQSYCPDPNNQADECNNTAIALEP